MESDQDYGLTRRRVLTAGAVTAAGLALAACSSGTASRAPAGRSTGPRGANRQSPRTPYRFEPYGLAMSDSLFFAPNTDAYTQADNRMKGAQALGARLIRVDFDGNIAQPNQPRAYNWAPTDAIVAAARNRKLQILATVAFSPPQLRDKSCTTAYQCMPAQLGTYLDFAYRVAERYGSYVKAFEGWDQPNVDPGADPLQYAELITGLSTVVKRHIPEAAVIFGALAPAATTETTTEGAEFFSKAVKAGAAGFTGVGWQAYSYPNLPNQSAPWSGVTQLNGNPNIVGMPLTLAQALEDNGMTGLPVVICEAGAPTNPNLSAKQAELIEGNWYMTQEQQAQAVGQIMTMDFPGLHIASRNIFTMTDQPDDGGLNPVNHFGLYGISEQGLLVPKPAAAQYYAATH